MNDFSRRDFVKGAAAFTASGTLGCMPRFVCGDNFTSPNYWCTWATQGKMVESYKASGDIKFAGDQGIAGIRENLNEHVLFRKDAGWARQLYPQSRGELNFLLDDGWDVGFGLNPWRDCDKFGSMILRQERFPSFKGSPAERLERLVKTVRDLGWKGLGLWVAPQMQGESWVKSLPFDKVKEDLRRKIGWCGEAGVSYLKVDWGARDGDIAYRRLMSQYAKELAPGMLVEHCRTLGIPINGVCTVSKNGVDRVVVGNGRWENDGVFHSRVRHHAKQILQFSDSFRIYDMVEPLFVIQAVERAQVLMRMAEKVGGSSHINVEDVPYLASSLAMAMGVMRANIWPKREGDVVRRSERTGEVTRAVAWQRIAPPCRSDRTFPTRRSDASLTDVWTFGASDTWYRAVHGVTVPQTAPAITTRGEIDFPEVSDVGDGVPLVTAMRHPNGALAIAALPRVSNSRGYFAPAANVRFTADAADVPVGVFGRFKNLVLSTSKKPIHVFVRDLAGDREHDIIKACRVERCGELFSVTLPGEIIEKIGKEAIDDLSSPGAIVRI